MIKKEQILEFIETQKFLILIGLSLILVLLLIIFFLSIHQETQNKKKSALSKKEIELAIPIDRMWFSENSLKKPQFQYFRGSHEKWTEEETLSFYTPIETETIEKLRNLANQELQLIFESVP